MLLSVEDVSVVARTRHGDRPILKQISVNLNPGEIVALVGESGAGKSTVGNAVIGLIDKPLTVTGGRILYDGRNLLEINVEMRRRLRGTEIAMIFQDPQTSLDPLMTIGRQLTETMVAKLGLTEKEAHKRAVELLARVGIPEPARRMQEYPHQFSGGMRQRVVIALALSCDPKVIIADEPTTALDVTLQSRILHLIRELCIERNLGVLLVTHNMGVVAELADRVVVMCDGHVVEQGLTDDILGNPREAYTQALIEAVPRMEAARRRFAPSSDRQAVLSVRDLSVEFRIKGQGVFGRKRAFRALNGVDLDLREGEILGIVGESGSGKSTVARAIAGLNVPSNGSINFGEHKTGATDRSAQPLQMIFQDPYASLNPRMRVRDIIAEPLDYTRSVSSRAEREMLVNEMLEKVGLDPGAAGRFPHEFSGGQRQRISIARALIVRPDILICDEPTSALDVSVQRNILRILVELRREFGLSILFISHDLAVVREICDRVAVMNRGEIVECGSIDDVFDTPIHHYTRTLIGAMPSTIKLRPKGEPVAMLFDPQA